MTKTLVASEGADTERGRCPAIYSLIELRPCWQVVAVGHTNAPYLFICKEGKWMLAGSLEQKGKTSAAGAQAARTSVFSAAFEKVGTQTANSNGRWLAASHLVAYVCSLCLLQFHHQDSFGQDASAKKQESNTTHQGCITCVRKMRGGKLSTSGMDGKLAVWKMEKPIEEALSQLKL